MLFLLPILIGFAGLLAAYLIYQRAIRAPLDDAQAAGLSDAIHEAAMIFLRREYAILGAFAAVLAIVLAAAFGVGSSAAFLLGAVSSVAAGYAGVRTATRTNARTALAARSGGVAAALSVAFDGGSVMGLLVGALGLLGLGTLHLLLRVDLVTLQGVALFGLGASAVALFARVGGGIYTKSADVGADLAGKIELKIPEDDRRNPGVIADNVGDNVGDIGGMGADIFESYCGSIIAALALALSLSEQAVASFGPREHLVLLPLALPAAGMLACLLALPAVYLGFRRSPRFALMLGLTAAGVFYGVLSWLTVEILGLSQSLFAASISGALAGIAIGLSTEYFTSGRRIVQIADAGRTGPATVIIAGLTVGMNSTALPLLAVGATMMVASQIAGVFGVALAAVGMLATVAMVMAMDAYGPIADNAGGIAEMCGLGEATRRATDELDALGNTTAAIGKGFAIGAAALATLSMINAFVQEVALQYGTFELNLSNPLVLLGLMIGSVLPFLLSAHTLRAVGRTATLIVEEIRRQFREIPGLAEGKADPDSTRCTEIAVAAAMRQTLLPGLMAVAIPPLVGFALGPEALGGLLGGALITGLVLALFMVNSGGAWDNAKKHVETGYSGGKGSPVHDACVVGDTVGDPLKDTAGPSINILIKVLAITSLAIAPLLP